MGVRVWGLEKSLVLLGFLRDSGRIVGKGDTAIQSLFECPEFSLLLGL